MIPPSLLANLQALEFQMKSTVELTSIGRIKQAGQPSLSMPVLLAQSIANQVVIMGALRDLIIIMVAPEEVDQNPPDLPPSPRDS